MDLYFDDVDIEIEEEEEPEDKNIEEIEEEYIVVNEQEMKENISQPVMTIYEKSNLLAKRVKQLDNNYKSTLPIKEIEKLKNNGRLFSYYIAEKEYQMNLLPNFKIKRLHPNDKYELWSLDEFEVKPE